MRVLRGGRTVDIGFT
jgi:16S rRNA (adenine(1408)-N(1))-methyltransferase